MQRNIATRFLSGITFFLIMNIIAGGWYLLSTFYAVTSVKVEGATLRGLGVLNHQNMLLLDTKDIETYLLHQNPFLANIHVVKHYPHTLLITLEKRTLLAKVTQAPLTLYADTTHTLLPVLYFGEQDVPIIETTYLPLAAGQIPDWRIQKALSYISFGKESGITIRKILIPGNTSLIRLFLTDDTRVIVPQQKDPSQVAASLQHIVHRFRIEGKSVHEINFQFEKPTVLLKDGQQISSL